MAGPLPAMYKDCKAGLSPRIQTTMKRQVVLHPILFALYPVVFLYGRNNYLYEPWVMLSPAVVSVALAAAVWALLRLCLGDWRLAAILVSAGFVVLTSFGAILDQSARFALRKQGLMDRGISTGDMIVLASVLAVVLICVAFVKLRRFIHEWTYLMNVMGTMLICLPLSGTLMHAYVTSHVAKTVPQQLLAPEPGLTAKTDQRPDIYYIVLDGYGRNDVMETVYGYDNSYFTDALTEKGFFVADQSRSNYSHTITSISSALNMEYLQNLLGENLESISDRRFLREIIGRNQVVEFLKKAGYSIVAFSSEYYDIRLGNADVVLEPEWTAHPFDLALLDMTPAPWILGRLGRPPLYDHHRKRLLYTIDNLPAAAKLPGPKFVFAHILLAHPPFVFDAEGKPVQPDRRFNMMVWGNFDDYINGYRDQVHYLNQRFLRSLDSLLKASDQPPVVIVQGDHGPGSHSDGTTAEGTAAFETYSILNAYLLPGGSGEMPYPSITPVNSFRVVFNRYFQTGLKLLEDRTYFSNFTLPHDFTPVTLEDIQRSEQKLQAESLPRK
jgi:hypothetical protein